MSIFGNILTKIFPGHQPASQPGNAPAPASGGANSAPSPAAQSQPAAPAQPVQAVQAVDVEAVLNGLAAQNPQKLNWRTSIVDLMKLLDLDSSLASRKELAHELGYAGDTNDSATMNVWLHKQVMKKLADNGGKVPAELRD